MPEANARLIRELEDRRFAAVVSEDFDTFAELCHPRLRYTHSNGVTDTLESYLRKCRSGYYRYLSVEHPVEEIVVVGDVALVHGEMNADLTVGAVPVRLANRSLAVWVYERKAWRFIAYAPAERARAGE